MSDSEDENFCFYGKALEPYDEGKVNSTLCMD